MCGVNDSQYDLYKVPIAEIKLYFKSKDDVPAVLQGLQALHGYAKTRERLFEILKKRMLPEVSQRHVFGEGS